MKWKKWILWIKKNKWLILAAAAGVLLLLWPTGEKKEPSAAEKTAEEEFSLEEQEEKLQKILSQIQGAGKVSVLLALEDNGQVVLAENREESTSLSDSETKREVIILSDGDRAESPAVLKSSLPTYKGALVVAEGAGQAEIRLKITRAVQAVTGLGSDKITVIQ